MTEQTSVAQAVQRLAEPVASDLGLELVHVVYQHEPEGWVLRLLIERKEGRVTVEDCRRLSRDLADLLDVEDPIPSAYRLEVSSPGLDRPLVKETDFDRFAGRKITLRTHQPMDGRKKFTGLLIGRKQGRIELEIDGTRLAFDPATIAKANLVPEIDGFPSRPGNC